MSVWRLRAGGPPAEPGTWAVEMQALLAQVRDSTFTLALPLLGAVALVVVSASALPDLTKARLCATALLWPGGLAWLLRGRSPYLAGWLLVVGWSAIVIALAAWAGMSAALWLLAFSGGLAVLLLGMRAGVGVATILTLMLVAAPEAWFYGGAGRRPRRLNSGHLGHGRDHLAGDAPPAASWGNGHGPLTAAASSS